MTSTRAKDSSLLKEAVEFLSNPVTDWADPNDSTQGAAEGGMDRSELQFMIARKRHNDAVRLAELSLLRRIRQEGLTGDQIREMERAQGFAPHGLLAEAPDAARPAAAGAPAPRPGQALTMRSYEADTIVLPLRETDGQDQPGTQLAAEPSGRPASVGRPGRAARAEPSATTPPKVKPAERLSGAEVAEREAATGQAQRTAGRLAGSGLPTEREEVTHDAELDHLRLLLPMPISAAARALCASWLAPGDRGNATFRPGEPCSISTAPRASSKVSNAPPSPTCVTWGRSRPNGSRFPAWP